MIKRTEHMTGYEINNQEVEQTAERVLKKLKKIEALVDEIYIKTSMSHSLIIVRKISEDKIDKLAEILD